MLIPQVYGDRRKLTPAIYRQYLAPLATPEDRHGLFAFAAQVFSESDWCEELWERRGSLAGIPAAIVWGMRDPLFGQRFLARWREALPGAEVLTLPGAGHFVQEEAPALGRPVLLAPVASSADEAKKGSKIELFVSHGFGPHRLSDIEGLIAAGVAKGAPVTVASGFWGFDSSYQPDTRPAGLPEP